MFLLSVEAYVKSIGQPELLDLLAQPTSEDATMETISLRSVCRVVKMCALVLYHVAAGRF